MKLSRRSFMKATAVAAAAAAASKGDKSHEILFSVRCAAGR